MSFTPSLYSQHFTDPELVAKTWSDVLVNNLGIYEAQNCVSIPNDARSNNNEKTTASTTKSTCSLPPGWTFDKTNTSSPEESSGFVPKSLPPKTIPFPNHPKKGDCLVASEEISAGTTLITEASLLCTPQDPSLFITAAASAKAIENRSKLHSVVSKASAAAAAFIRICYQNTAEDESKSSNNYSASESSSKNKNNNNNNKNDSTFGFFRSVCPQWAAVLIFQTLVKIGSTAASFSSTDNNDINSCTNSSLHQQMALVETFLPGWEVTTTFSACSCGGEQLEIPTKPGTEIDEQNLEKLQDEVSRINSYRISRWSEWTCAAKVIHRIMMKVHSSSVVEEVNNSGVDDNNHCTANKNSKIQNVVPLQKQRALQIAKRIHKLLTNSSSSNAENNNSNSSSDSGNFSLLLCSLALDLNGFLTSKTIEETSYFFSNSNNNTKHQIKASSSSSSSQSSKLMTKSAGLITKPALRLAYFFDAVSSNCVEVSVPGIPKRLAVFPYSRLAEHECRPSCSVSFLDAPTLQSSAAFLPGTQLQWDDPVHGCLVSGGLRQHRLVEQDKKRVNANKSNNAIKNNNSNDDNNNAEQKEQPEKKHSSEVAHQKSSAGHEIENYGGGAAVNILLIPSVICLTATRDIPAGDGVSIAYTASALMTRHERQRDLIARYGFKCSCIWCAGFAPDLARAFRCPKCPKGTGVVCPRADGSQLTLWECIQCGHHPDFHFIDLCCDKELEVSRKSRTDDLSAATLHKLVDDEFLHYSHAHVCRKLDFWAERAWREQDAEFCMSIVEVLLRCIDRVGNDDIDGFASVMRKTSNTGNNNDNNNAQQQNNAALPAGVILPFISENRAERRGPSKWDVNPPRDVMLAQYLELLGKANHAVGNAHTSRYYYSTALAIRERSGQSLSWWCRATRFMAVTKSLADLMDSK